MEQTEQRLQDRPAVWWTFAAIIVAGQGADVLSTLLLLHAGGGEGNRVARFLMQAGGWPLLIGSKLALGMALAALLLALAANPDARRTWAGAFALLLGACFAVGWWLLILWNGVLWLIAAHLLPTLP